MEDYIIEGIASQDMVNAVAATAARDAAALTSRIRDLEEEIHRLKHQFNASLAREIAERCERFANDREPTGMTDMEFEAELERLLCG